MGISGDGGGRAGARSPEGLGIVETPLWRRRGNQFSLQLFSHTKDCFRRWLPPAEAGVAGTTANGEALTGHRSSVITTPRAVMAAAVVAHFARVQPRRRGPRVRAHHLNVRGTGIDSQEAPGGVPGAGGVASTGAAHLLLPLVKQAVAERRVAMGAGTTTACKAAATVTGTGMIISLERTTFSHLPQWTSLPRGRPSRTRRRASRTTITTRPT